MENKQELPAGWKWVKLGEVCEIIMGQSPPSTSYNKINKGLPFFQGKADFDTYFPKVRIWCSQPIKIVEEGTILISVRAPVGPVNISNTKCCIGRGLAGIRTKEEKAFNWYFFWYLFSKEHEIASIGSGSTFSAISKGDLANLVVPLPPLSEQRRIAEKLKAMMDEIDEAKASIEKQLEAAKALPSAYLREVFESPEAQKWEKKKLGEVCEYSSGIWGDEPDNSENCYFVLRSNNIKDGKMIFTDLALRKVDAKYVESKCLKNGDILVTTSSGSKDLLGKSAIFIPPNDRTYLFSNFTMRLRANSLLADSFYVFLYLQSPEAKKILQLLQDTTTGLRNLDRREFMNQLIPLPPLSEQKRIATYLKEKIDKAEKLRETLEKELETFNTLPQSILSKAFRGEI